MIVTWAFGVQLAPQTCANWLTGGGVGCTLYAAGLLGGFVGTLGLMLVVVVLFPRLRQIQLLAAMLLVGTATGALLELGPYWVFCGWQASINALIGFGFIRARG